MEIKAYVTHNRSNSTTDWNVRVGDYNEYYLPSIQLDEEMWIIVTGDDGEVTRLHLKR